MTSRLRHMFQLQLIIHTDPLAIHAIEMIQANLVKSYNGI